VDAIGDAYVTGYAGRDVLPLANPLQGTFGGGDVDSFVTKIGFSTRANQFTFNVPNRGGTSQTAAALGAGTVGYGRLVLPAQGSPSPEGVAILSQRQNGVLVSEVGVPASPVLNRGRVYAEIDGPFNTGVAMANGNGVSVNVTFFFTDDSGRDFGEGTITIPPNGQIARFLSEAPFKAPQPFRGTLTFSASAPIGFAALRGSTNERSEFVMTTLPVADLSSSAVETAIAPHFVDGGSWTTTVVLVNGTDSPENGTVEFWGQGSANSSAQPVLVTVNGLQAGSFTYTIPGRSAIRLQTSGLLPDVQVGSVRVVPAPAGGGQTPAAFVVFAFKRSGGAVAAASVPAQRPGSAFRLYVESSGSFNSAAVGSFQSGIVVTNTLSSPLPISFELTSLTGVPTGLTANLVLPAQGQRALFLNQIPGFQSLPQQFQGVLRVATTAGSGLVAAGLRGRYNERGDFLITTMPSVNEANPPSIAETMFPHLVIGGGYTTQFILFGGTAQSAGAVRFVNQSGQPLNVALRPN
jgi:hypothetical protein